MERSFLLLALVVPPILFFLLNGDEVMPFLYVTLDASKIVLIGVIICYSVSSTQFMKRTINAWLFFTAIASFGLSRVFVLYSLSYPSNAALSVVGAVFYYLSEILFVLILIMYSYKLQSPGISIEDNVEEKTDDEVREESE